MSDNRIFVEVPADLSEDTLYEEFGVRAARHYLNRVKRKMAQGNEYKNPVKLAYIWAKQDQQSGTGFWEPRRRR